MWSYAEPQRWSSGRIDLDESEIHHAVQVMRIRDGEALHVLDGCGRYARGILQVAGRREAHILPEETGEQPRSPLASVTLAPALCKPARWDWMLEKATELGLGRLLPLATKHCVTQASGKKAEAKAAKWKATCIRACKQSHNAWLPVVEDISGIPQWLSGNEAVKLAGAITEDADPLARVLPDLAGSGGGISVAIGPEGDFSADEYEQLRSAGVHMVSLGPLVLRCETASLYVLNSIRYEIERQDHG